MVPFDFELRTRVVFGHRSLGRLGHLARELKFQRTLIVADRGVAETRHVAEASRVLAEAGIEAIGFHDFAPNPDSATIEHACRTAEPLGVDSLVAFGGGSSINCARALNFVLTNGGNVTDYRGYGKAGTPLLPTIAVPTTAGTGAEALSYAVLLDTPARALVVCGDASAAARIALLDPELTSTAPRHVTAMSGFDAIAHAVEAAVTSRRTPLSDTFSHRAWRLLNDAFERVVLHPTDTDARASMQLGAHFAGIAVERSMLGAAHACAHPLTARWNVTHGLALAILLPHVVRWNANVATDRYAALLGSPRRRHRDDDAAEALASRLEDLANAGGLRMTLSDSGINEEALPALAEQAAQDWTASFNPRPLDAAGALEIYRAAL